MPRLMIAGEPGAAYHNAGPKVLYQLLVNWQNSCAVCIQFDHQVGDYWPIPFHRGCRCRQVPILPDAAAEPFVDYRAKILTIPRSQQAVVMGRSNLAMVENGLVAWDDVVTPQRIRSLREVASRKKLTVEQMVKAGVGRREAEEAVAAVSTGTHTLAEQRRQAAVRALLAKGYTRDQIKEAAGKALGSRLGIGGGPARAEVAFAPASRKPGPTKPAKVSRPKSTATPAKEVELSTLGKAGPILPDRPIAERLAAYAAAGGDAKLDAARQAVAGAAGELETSKVRRDALANRLQSLRQELRDAEDDPARTAQLKAERVAALNEIYTLEARGKTVAELTQARLRDVLKVDKPLEIGNDEGPIADELRKFWKVQPVADRYVQEARDGARAWYAGIIREDGRGDRLDLKFGQLAEEAEQRAYYSTPHKTVVMGRFNSAPDVIHELGHAIETYLAGGGARDAHQPTRDFLAYRVGDEPNTKLNAVLGKGYRADEVGRKDKFGEVFGKEAWYVGKDYPVATEILAMGLEKLHRDPATLIENDPEYAKFLFGILDGSLR